MTKKDVISFETGRAHSDGTAIDGTVFAIWHFVCDIWQRKYHIALDAPQGGQDLPDSGPRAPRRSFGLRPGLS